MREIRWQDDEIAVVQEMVDDLAGDLDTIEDGAFVRRSRVFAQEFPRRIRSEVNDFRLTESSSTLLVTGWPVADAGLGPTPADPKHKPVPSPTIRHDLMFFLLASLLGDPIGWATQQDGYLMHDVYPVPGFEQAQIGWGSEELLTWHTEDAFHPLRTDYLGLLCLRNPDAVTTTVCDMGELELDADTRRVLSENRFRLVPDDSHRSSAEPGPGRGERETALYRRGLARVEKALADPEPVAVLFGDLDQPYVRLDPSYMLPPRDDAERRALEKISSAIDAAMSGVALTPGDVVFVDNYRAVHGRRPFRARFDGTDRWLRRLNVARDLRPSRSSRLSPDARVIH